MSCRCHELLKNIYLSWASVVALEVLNLHLGMLLFSCPVVSNSWQPHGLHAASQASLCLTISWNLPKFMSIALMTPSSHLIIWHLQSFPASGSFPMNQVFASDDQGIGASVSAWVLPVNIQGWLVWSPCCPRSSQVFSNTTVWNHQFPALCLLYGPALTTINNFWKTIAMTIWTFVGMVIKRFFSSSSLSAIRVVSSGHGGSLVAARGI